MKQLEQRLHSSASPEPERPLSADFTARISGQLAGKPWPAKRRPKWKEYLQMKLHKPAIATAAILATVALGGTAYAAVGGINGIRAFFTSEQPTKDGGRIVQLGTHACPRVDAFNITNKNRTDYQPYYVRVKAGSKLSNQQIVHIIEGVCQADAEGTINGAAMQQIESRPENKDKLVAGYADSVVLAASKSSLTIRSEVPYYTKNSPEIHSVTQTYTHIDTNAVVIDQGKTVGFDTLTAGDHIAITYRPNDASGGMSEAVGPDKIDPDSVTIVAATRLTQAMQDYFNYSRYQAHDFEQVVPCSSTPSGYCNVEEYLKNK